MIARAALAVVLLLPCCDRPVPPRAAVTHYLVGQGYQVAGVWYYPREDFHYEATGLATVQAPASGLTANGETVDATAMTAAHQTLQLPCIVRITNLETGAQALVRVNDRGPASPARLVALSPRAATILGVAPSGTARVRVSVEEAPSEALRDQLDGGPRLEVAAAPRSSVAAEPLPPPAGIAQSQNRRSAGAMRTADTVPTADGDRIPDRLPETLSQVAPAPGHLVIHAGSFATVTSAQQVAARLAVLAARVERQRQGRGERYTVEAGPYQTVSDADAALDRAIQAGVSDARIVVE